jgi:hypothetical protein
MTHVQKSPASGTVARLLPEQFSFLLKDRPTLFYERREDYDRLLAALIAQYDPNSVTDALLIKDLADCQWEVLRLRRMKKAALAVEMEQAAWKLMSRTLDERADELKLPKDKESFSEVVRVALQDSGPPRDQIRELQSYAGVSDDMLLYKTFALSHGTMSALNAALAGTERRRDQLVRMLEDRGRTAAAMSKLLPQRNENTSR